MFELTAGTQPFTLTQVRTHSVTKTWFIPTVYPASIDVFVHDQQVSIRLIIVIVIIRSNVKTDIYSARANYLKESPAVGLIGYC